MIKKVKFRQEDTSEFSLAKGRRSFLSLSLSLSGTKINLDIWMWFAPRTEEILRGDLRLDSNFLKIDWSKRIIWSAPK